MTFAAPLFLALATAQAAEPGERLVLSDRTELRGLAAAVDDAGAVRFRDRASGRELAVAPEEIGRIVFSDELPVRDPAAEQLRLHLGGTLSGRVRSADAEAVILEHPAGTLRVRRDGIRAIVLGPLGGAAPELKEEPADILLREGDDGTPTAEYGRLKAIGETVSFAVGEETRTYPRAKVRQILLHRAGATADPPPGWFAKAVFRNGDRVIGVLRSFTADKVGLFVPPLGDVEFPKAAVQALAFVPQARLSIGNLIVCDQAGVREFDRQGRELWAYTQSVQYAWSARKLDNGNVLIANTNYNQVLEVKPSGRNGGEIVWRLDQVSYPYDAIRLENGNTLVAEYAANRVAEYDARTKAAVWQHRANTPSSIQVLENDRVLIGSVHQVVEVDRQGKEQWKLTAPGVRAHRALRLENGHTLVTDHRGQVVEFDSGSKRMWVVQGLQRPVQAIRLEDGNTLILEQGNNRIVEVDPLNTKKHTPVLADLLRLQFPQGMSLY
ncbi:MAG TPA: PQQ-binding-like beta-propeller repeat protein [Planctomycetota bacterium]|nr:PQQ-binding-like beta-propeller repeat protein [Planctomycetota bacterium]